jgi:Restriction endonuclease
MVKNDPLWRIYEQAVSSLLAAMDSNADVAHNAMVLGRLSGESRQVDVLARGTVIGLEINVAVECKRYNRAIGIGIIDQFVGKLLDLGAERGVLYAYSGFTEAAVRRAIGSSSPSVLLVALESPDVAGAPYDADLAGPVDPMWVDELGMQEYRIFLQTGRWW